MAFDSESGFYVADGRLPGGGGEVNATVTVFLKKDDGWAITFQVHDGVDDNEEPLDEATCMRRAAELLLDEAARLEQDDIN